MACPRRRIGCSSIPLVGPTATEYWNSWAADLGVMADFFRPYFGMIAEKGLSLLLGIASGVLQFMLALFIGFFFWLYGDVLAVKFSTVIRRIAGGYADRLITVTGQVVRGTVYGILGTAIVQGLLTAVRPVADRGAAPGAAGSDRRVAVGAADWRAAGVDSVRVVAADAWPYRVGDFLGDLWQPCSSPARTM